MPAQSDGGEPPRARRGLARAIAVGLVLVLLLAVVAQTFFVGLYSIESLSMEPTLHGAPSVERVLVRYERGFLPKRQELVVAALEGERDPLIKRVLGLPGESVQILHGDVLVNGKPIPESEPRPPWILVRDLAADGLATHWDVDEALEGQPWRRAPGDRSAEFRLRGRVRDDRPAADGSRVEGPREVGDLALAVRIERAPMAAPDSGDPLPAQVLVLALTEADDELEAELTWSDPRSNTAHVRLLRRAAGGPAEILLEADLEVDVGARLFLANRDDVLALEVGGRRLSASIPGRTPFPAGAGEHRLPRARLAVRGLTFELRTLELLRDLHYTSPPNAPNAVAGPLRLGPDQVFLLGDNSSVSRDSRFRDAPRLDQLIGRPWWVVWPPSSLRRL